MAQHQRYKLQSRERSLLPTGTAAKAINLTLALETIQKEEELGAQTSAHSSASAAGKGKDWDWRCVKA